MSARTVTWQFGIHMTIQSFHFYRTYVWHIRNSHFFLITVIYCLAISYSNGIKYALSIEIVITYNIFESSVSGFYFKAFVLKWKVVRKYFTTILHENIKRNNNKTSLAINWSSGSGIRIPLVSSFYPSSISVSCTNLLLKKLFIGKLGHLFLVGYFGLRGFPMLWIARDVAAVALLGYP